jgi:hypothetical protein
VSAPTVPYSEVSERNLLGAALWHAETAELIATEVAPEDFYLPLHGAIARSIRGLVLGGNRVDPNVVAAELERDDQAGGVARARFLAELMSGSAAGSAKRCAEEVWDCAFRRRIIGASAAVSLAAQDRRVPVDDVAEEARRLVGTVEMPVAAAEPDPDVAEFLADSEEFDWVIPGLLERGDRLIVTGEEGQGKSTLLRQLAVCTAAGIGLFHASTMTPRRVLIVDCENGRAQVRRALRSLVISAARDGVPVGAGMLRICCRPDGLDLANRADVRFLHERLQADQPEVLVIGPLYKMVNASPIEEEPAAKVARTLDTLRVRYGVSLVIEAHSPHAQGGAPREMRPYGASLWRRWPEFGLGIVTSPDDRVNATLKHWRGPREERAWPQKIRRGGSWPWSVVL